MTQLLELETSLPPPGIPRWFSYLGEYHSFTHHCKNISQACKTHGATIILVYYDDQSEYPNAGWCLFYDCCLENHNIRHCPFCHGSLEPWLNNVVVE